MPLSLHSLAKTKSLDTNPSWELYPAPATYPYLMCGEINSAPPAVPRNLNHHPIVNRETLKAEEKRIPKLP